MTVRIRGEQLGYPFSVSSTAITVSGTLDTVDIYTNDGVTIHGGLTVEGDESDINFVTTSGSVSIIDTLYPTSGLTISSDISSIIPVTPGTPGIFLTIPSTGAQLLGNIIGDINSCIIIKTLNSLGTDGVTIYVGDQDSNNTFSTEVSVYPNDIVLTAIDVTNDTETKIEATPTTLIISAKDDVNNTEGYARFGLDFATVGGTAVTRVVSDTEVEVGIDDTHRVHITNLGVTINGHILVEDSDFRLNDAFTHIDGIKIGIDSQVTHTASGTGISDFTYAVGSTTTALGDGHHNNLASLLAAVHFTGDGTATQLLAVDAVTAHHGSNTITSMYAGNFAFELTDAGNVTNAIAVQLAAPTYSGAGRIGTNMGLYVANLGYAGQTASSAIVILDQSGSTTLNNSIYAYGGKAEFNVSNTAAADFNIHGQNDDDAFYLDVSTDSLGLGTATPSSKLDIVKEDSNTGSVVDVLELTHSITGTAASGIGTGLAFYSEDASGNIDEAGRINCKFPTATHASQTGQMDLSAFGTTLFSLFTGATAATNRVTVSAHTNFQGYVPFFTEYNNGNVGSGTIDWNNGIKQKITITGAPSVLAFTNPPGPCNITFKIIQGSGGSKTITWPSSSTVKWPGGTAPTLSTAAGAIDIISFYFDGSVYYGDSSLNFS